MVLLGGSDHSFVSMPQPHLAPALIWTCQIAWTYTCCSWSHCTWSYPHVVLATPIPSPSSSISISSATTSQLGVCFPTICVSFATRRFDPFERSQRLCMSVRPDSIFYPSGTTGYATSATSNLTLHSTHPSVPHNFRGTTLDPCDGILRC